MAEENLIEDDDLLAIELDEPEVVEAKTDGTTPPEKPAAPEPKAEEPPAPAETTPDDAVAELKRQLAEQRAAREQAERRAQEVEQTAKAEINDSRHRAITAALEDREGRLASAKRLYADALRDGEYDKVAEIQAAIAQLINEKTTLSRGKAELERYLAEQPELQAVQSQEEQLLSKVSPKSAAWLRQHRECMTDPKLNARMIAGHQLAIADGIEPDSDAYFEMIEKTVGIKKEPAREPIPVPKKPVPAAPARTGSTTGANGRTVVTLTREQREAADMMGMSYKEYATELMKIQKEKAS